MSRLFRYAVVLACVCAYPLGAAETDPETEARILADLAEHDASETARHRRAPLPPTLLPMLKPIAPGDPAAAPHPAVETLRIGRCDPVDPPPRP